VPFARWSGRGPGRLAPAVAALVLLGVSGSNLVQQPAFYTRVNIHNLVFRTLLPDSSDPAGALRQFGCRRGSSATSTPGTSTGGRRQAHRPRLPPLPGEGVAGRPQPPPSAKALVGLAVRPCPHARRPACLREGLPGRSRAVRGLSYRRGEMEGSSSRDREAGRRWLLTCFLSAAEHGPWRGSPAVAGWRQRTAAVRPTEDGSGWSGLYVGRPGRSCCGGDRPVEVRITRWWPPGRTRRAWHTRPICSPWG